MCAEAGPQGELKSGKRVCNADDRLLEPSQPGQERTQNIIRSERVHDRVSRVADARSKAGGTCSWRLLPTGNAQRRPLSPFPPCQLPAYSFTTRSSAAERSIASISLWRVTARSKSTSNPVPAAKACAARL